MGVFHAGKIMNGDRDLTPRFQRKTKSDAMAEFGRTVKQNHRT
jgi:hypothetical protein